jgi:hypothetical protein
MLIVQLNAPLSRILTGKRTMTGNSRKDAMNRNEEKANSLCLSRSASLSDQK